MNFTDQGDLIKENDKHHSLQSRTSIIFLFKIEAAFYYTTMVDTYCSVLVPRDLESI